MGLADPGPRVFLNFRFLSNEGSPKNMMAELVIAHQSFKEILTHMDREFEVLSFPSIRRTFSAAFGDYHRILEKFFLVITYRACRGESAYRKGLTMGRQIGSKTVMAGVRLPFIYPLSGAARRSPW